MNEEKDIVENEIMPMASVNDMLRTMAFTSRQTGGSFLVRHADQDSGVWLYHLGVEEEGFVHITQRVSVPMSVWLDVNSWNVAWPTVGEQFERLQGEADEHLYRAHREQDSVEKVLERDPLGREALLHRMRVWGEGPEVARKKMGIEEVLEELGRAVETGEHIEAEGAKTDGLGNVGDQRVWCLGDEGDCMGDCGGRFHDPGQPGAPIPLAGAGAPELRRNAGKFTLNDPPHAARHRR